MLFIYVGVEISGSSGAIAGGVVAAIVVILLCIGSAILAFVYYKRRQRAKFEASRLVYLRIFQNVSFM